MRPVDSLCEAIRKRNRELVEAVLAESPSAVNDRNADGQTPLLFAIYAGQKEIVELLLQKGARMDIFAAAAIGETELVRRIVQKEPQLLNIHADDGWTPLHLAAFFGHTSTVRILLDSGANPRTISQNMLRNTHSTQPSQPIRRTSPHSSFRKAPT